MISLTMNSPLKIECGTPDTLQKVFSPASVLETSCKGPVKVVHFTSGHTAMDVRIFGRECRTLAKAGYEVTIVAPRCPGKGRSSSTSPPEDGTYDGIHVRQVAYEENRPHAVIKHVWRVLRLLTRTDADVYHFHDPELILVGLWISLRGKVVLYDSHENSAETIRHVRWIPRHARRLASCIFRNCESFVASRLSGIIAANDAIVDRFSGYNSNVVRVANFPSLADFDGVFNPRDGREPGKIVNFGGISEHTCTEQIVDAMALLCTSCGAHLVLGGETFSPQLLKRISWKPAWKNVEFIGLIARQSLMHHLQKASVAIILYSPEPNHFGVGSNRFFEALAAGIPVITSDFPAWRQIVETAGCGLTVSPNDPHAIAKALEYLLSHPSEAREMGSRGQQAFRETYNWEHEEKKLLRLYEQIIVAPPPAPPVRGKA